MEAICKPDYLARLKAKADAETVDPEEVRAGPATAAETARRLLLEQGHGEWIEKVYSACWGG